ncbi:helix-turn-helix domain-containing protein [Labilibaculum sp.]|uniref:helix-turn-helix domain-containing protein n=1 Tax=Labilibaculum sp. TaxID=2060723 RepID=UPI003569A534
MSNTIQFIQVTPEQLQKAIITGVKEQLNDLKDLFQPKEPTEYLTRNEVKELLHVDLSTVHNWTKKGKLKAYGIGNRIYYKRHEVEQAIIPIQSI